MQPGSASTQRSTFARRLKQKDPTRLSDSRNTKSLAEVVLRVGAGVGGWVIAFAYGLVLASLPIGACTFEGDETFRGASVFGLIAALTAVLLGLSMPWKQSLRWMATVAGLMLLVGGYRLEPFLTAATLDGAHLCRDLASAPAELAVSWWHPYWAPFHLLVVSALLLQAVRTLRGGPGGS